MDNDAVVHLIDAVEIFGAGKQEFSIQIDVPSLECQFFVDGLSADKVSDGSAEAEQSNAD